MVNVPTLTCCSFMPSGRSSQSATPSFWALSLMLASSSSTMPAGRESGGLWAGELAREGAREPSGWKLVLNEGAREALGKELVAREGPREALGRELVTVEGSMLLPGEHWPH